jgi:hypothetical protein
MRIVRGVSIACMLAVASLGFSTGSVAAYGHADQPLAQIELSLNCNNPDFPGCQPPPVGFGLGGVWLWIEIDAIGTADVAGAVCGHVRGEGGGASSIRGEFDWWWSDMPEGLDVTFGAPTDPNGYYNVDLGGGFVLSFPVTTGHYSFHPVPAVAVETQVAP